MRDESYCLVLSGGGAKGVYHIGAWKALNEMGIPVEAFIGNSIGAIVAAFLAQDDSEKLEAIIQEIGIDFILAMPKELIDDGEFRINEGSFKVFAEYTKSVMARRSLDTSPLRRLLIENIDEAKIRDNGKDLGVVTINTADFKPVEIFIDEIGKGELVNYLLASSAFPGFDQPEIGGKKYIDGGLYNNVPYSMAQKRGYRNIIVVDISGFGLKQKIDIEGYRTVYIKNSIDMGGVLNFNREFIERYQMLGYLDTLRTFGRLNGYRYFLKPNAVTEKEWRNEFQWMIDQGKLAEIIAAVCNTPVTGSFSVIRQVLPKYAEFDPRWLMVLADCTAYCLGLEPVKAWSYQEIISEILETIDRLEGDLKEVPVLGVNEIRRMIVKEIKNDTKQPYFYYLLISKRLSGRPLRLLTRFLIRVYPELRAAILFVTALKMQSLNSI